MNKTVEIRTYNLKPGSRANFARIASNDFMPMRARWGTDVVRHGPSTHDDDTCFLLRAYASLDDRPQRQDAFHGSDEWIQGPRASLLGLIGNFTSLVLEREASTLVGLRDKAVQA